GLHMISVSGSITPSSIVVVVGTGAMASGDYGAKSELSLVNALQRAGGHVVVAGDADSATQAGIVAEVRNSNAVRSSVSTVDDADGPIGQVTTVLALVDAIQANYGQYGTQR